MTVRPPSPSPQIKPLSIYSIMYFRKNGLMQGRILNYASINHLLSFMNAATKRVGADCFLPQKSCKIEYGFQKKGK